MSAANSRSVPTRRRRWLVRALFGVLGLLGVASVVCVATLAFGLVTGEEFSPGRFLRRSFGYYEIPLIGLQVTPIRRDDQTSALERYLRAQKLVVPDPSAPARWDLVRVERSGIVVFEADAAILCAYLDAADEDGKSYWKAWSTEHPKLAKALWPAVARLADQRLYLLAPRLFELAQAAGDPAAFSRELDRMLAREYRQLAEIRQELGLHEAALELLGEALRHAPDDPDLLQRQAQSQKALRQNGHADGEQGS